MLLLLDPGANADAVRNDDDAINIITKAVAAQQQEARTNATILRRFLTRGYCYVGGSVIVLLAR